MTTQQSLRDLTHEELVVTVARSLGVDEGGPALSLYLGDPEVQPVRIRTYPKRQPTNGPKRCDLPLGGFWSPTRPAADDVTYANFFREPMAVVERDGLPAEGRETA